MIFATAPANHNNVRPATRDRERTFLALLQQHRRIVYEVARAYGRTPEVREDLAQEITAALWQSFPRFDESRRFSTWMYRIALNVAISFVRAERRRNERLSDGDAAALEVAVAEAEPGDRVGRLHDFIATLGAIDKALMLLYLDAYSYADIAAALGLTETNVATKLARIKLKAKLALERDAVERQPS